MKAILLRRPGGPEALEYGRRGARLLAEVLINGPSKSL